jgi:hypothetical protein
MKSLGVPSDLRIMTSGIRVASFNALLRGVPMKKVFYITWLVFGFLQLGDASGAQLLSQEPTENHSSETSALPVRISRSFFEKQTSVETSYISSAGAQTHASLATWNENQGTPQKAVGALAVFNDHVGCAEIKELPPMQLCFDIQDDVSSLTLASGQMSVDGLSSVADLSCISDTRFLGAKKNGNSGFTVSYQLSPTDDVRCKSEGGVLNLTINAV